MELENDYTWIKTVLANFVFHFVVLGLMVRFAFYPDMHNENWLILIGMFLMMNPIIAYFYGWDINIGAACISAGAAFYKRTMLFVVLIGVYIAVLLKWLGIIEMGGVTG